MEEKYAPMKVINLVQRQDTYKIVIPTEVEKKIRYACKESWATEWSGTLFYTYSGTFENNDLVITCKDIFIMDIGVQTYTEFDMSPDVCSYMCEHPELLDCQMGLIHSHNNMSTFFSGTDQSTLKEEGKDRNNFVSLIVNNAGTYTAAITRRNVSTKTIKDCYKYEFFGEGPIEKCKDYEVQEEVIEWFYLKVEKEGDQVFEEMASRFKEIREAKSKEVKPKPVFVNSNILKTTSSAAPKSFTPKKTTEVIQKELPFEISDDSDIPYNIPYGEVHADKATVEMFVKEILTGSITINNNSNININDWVRVMEKVYDNRFGTEQGDFNYFSIWAETFIEYLVFYVEDDKLSEAGHDETEIAAIYSHDIVEELEKFPKNKYINEYIRALENYIV